MLREVVPNQIFKPFGNLDELKRLDLNPVSAEGFRLDVAETSVKLGGVKLSFNLHTTDALLIHTLPESVSPLGPINVNFTYSQGLYVVRSAPLGLEMAVTAKTVEDMRSAQWYDAEIMLGTDSFRLDSTQDYDVLLDSPTKLPEDEGLVLYAQAYSFGEQEELKYLLIPHELDKVRQIQCRIVDKLLP